LSCVIGLIVGGALNTHVELELEEIPPFPLMSSNVT